MDEHARPTDAVADRDETQAVGGDDEVAREGVDEGRIGWLQGPMSEGGVGHGHDARLFALGGPPDGHETTGDRPDGEHAVAEARDRRLAPMPRVLADPEVLPHREEEMPADQLQAAGKPSR